MPVIPALWRPGNCEFEAILDCIALASKQNEKLFPLYYFFHFIFVFLREVQEVRGAFKLLSTIGMALRT